MCLRDKNARWTMGTVARIAGSFNIAQSRTLPLAQHYRLFALE